MKITSVKVIKNEVEGNKMKGVASVVVNDAFAIHDIRIIESEKGLFLAMPSRKTSSGSFRDVAHPINAETRKIFEEAIFAEFNK